MNLIRKNIFSFFLAMQICAALSAQDFSAARLLPSADAPGSDTVLGDAYDAYGEGDYESALFLFRRALSDRQNQSDSVLYMTIMAGMRSGEYKTAYADTDYFLAAYPDSEYAPLVKYQAGRALFSLGDYENALIVLGDFCHENPENMMYASALFLIGECFYAEYDFDGAEPFYEEIVSEYPDSAKATDAQYRLDTINTRKREDKLLALLKETGENYFSSKEDYEKILRRYEFENSLGDARRLWNENHGHFSEGENLSVFDGTSLESEGKSMSRDKLGQKSSMDKNYIDPSSLDDTYVQRLIDHINALESDNPDLNRGKISELQDELDAVQEALKNRPISSADRKVLLDDYKRLKNSALEVQTLLDNEGK